MSISIIKQRAAFLLSIIKKKIQNSFSKMRVEINISFKFFKKKCLSRKKKAI